MIRGISLFNSVSLTIRFCVFPSKRICSMLNFYYFIQITSFFRKWRCDQKLIRSVGWKSVPPEMSHFRVSRATSMNSSIVSKLDAFLNSSNYTYNSKEESAEKWSRTQARAFYHTLKKPVEFLVLYSHCLKYLEAHSSAKAPVHKKKDDVFAKEGKCTDAEFNEGHSQMNAILHHEYSLWWDAFAQEETEDYENDALTAEDRFALYCGKILASKTGVSVEKAKCVVNAWLIEKHA